ncbi:MAG: MFS transporter [Vicinamibacterales bacterium]
MSAAVHPSRYAALYFPMGLMIGYPSVALGYLATRAGLPVSAAAAMVGVAFFAHALKFLWAPVVDYSLTRKTWYRLAIAVMAAVIVALTATPLSGATVPLVTALVFVGNLAATFVAFATEGLLAHNTGPGGRGRASGWFQSGNQFGQTAGGGLGLWLTQHLAAPWMAGALLAALLAACTLALVGLDEPPAVVRGGGIGARARDAWHELGAMLTRRDGRIGLLLAAMPIGTGAAQFLFGSLGTEWGASADAVSLTLGLVGGVAIVAGCMAGGALAARLPGARAYALSCGVSAVAALLIAVAPRTAAAFVVVTLLYTAAVGLCNATLTGMVLEVAGRGATATKMNVFFAMNTLFGLTMLRIDGAAHDRWGTSGMLVLEFAVGVVCLGAFALLRTPSAKPQP